MFKLWNWSCLPTYARPETGDVKFPSCSEKSKLWIPGDIFRMKLGIWIRWCPFFSSPGHSLGFGQWDKEQHMIQGQKDSASSSVDESGMVSGIYFFFNIYFYPVTLWFCWLLKSSNKHSNIFKVLTDTISLNLPGKEQKKMISKR